MSALFDAADQVWPLVELAVFTLVSWMVWRAINPPEGSSL